MNRRLETEFPGESFRVSTDVPLHKQVFLQRLGDLRNQCLSQGCRLDLEDLDRAVSEDGRIQRSVLAKLGYSIGPSAWARVQAESKTVKSVGGRPRLVDKDNLLEIAEEVLGRHSKVSSKVATVYKSSFTGRFGRLAGNTRGKEKMHVQAMSLLARPQAIFEQEPDLRSHMSLYSWRKILKEHFGEYRVGARKTDMCSHCQKHLLLVKDWNVFKADAKQRLERIMPAYFEQFDLQGEIAGLADQGDFASEARGLLKYISAHSRRFREARQHLSRTEQLDLYSFTEAPIEHEIKGFASTLEAFQWHRLSARRQQEALQALIDVDGGTTLPIGSVLVTYDWAEKIRLPLGPVETGSMWHAQQKLGVSCYAAAVFQHASDSVAGSPKIFATYVIYVTDCLEQTAEASNRLLRQCLIDAQAPTTGALHLWSDAGPHFRSAENLHLYVRELPCESCLDAFLAPTFMPLL